MPILAIPTPKVADYTLEPLQHADALAAFVGQNGFNHHALKDLKYLGFDASKATLVAELVVKPEHTNSWHTLHGGVAATLVDVVTSIAVSEAGHPTSGMSAELSVSYVNPAQVGQTVHIFAEVERVGANLAFTRAQLVVASTGALVASGRHTKFVGGAFASKQRPAPKL
ncbi:hypothetical protein H9P43_003875 [Blastocladiella emersonii ATCC 22665]|nr:hypothetical protein H9P43_003875 [Blastocladiella emersonii ATCC 22665]